MTTIGLMGRVGGVAAALGAGAVISLAVSAPASAEPTDTGRDTSHSVATPRRAAAEAPRARTAAAKSRPKSESARTDSAKPAAARVLRRDVAPAAAAPEVATPAAAAPAVAPVAAKAASAAAQWGDPRGRLITIYKGTHFAIPNSFGFFIKQVTGTGTFTANTVYDLKDVDQYDWNKFTGIAFTPLQPDRNSAMVGWRYNLKTQEFEIAPFYNVDKKRILPNELTEVISVPADQTFTYTVDYTGITVSYGDKTVFKPYPEGLTPKKWTAARVSGWFGGNEVAPRTVSYYLKINRR